MADLRERVSSALMNDALMEGGNAFRRRAIQACAATVARASPFHDADSAKTSLEAIITPRMMVRVLQIVTGERSPEDQVARVAQELMGVTCIGRVAAMRLANLGVASLEDLANRADEPDLALTAAQKLCLRYRHDIERRIPRIEMNAHAAAIADAADKSGGEAHVVGSYRRNCDSSGDIDVLLVGDLDAFLSPLVTSGYVVGTIARGGCKYNGIVRLPGHDTARRLDVLKTNRDELPFALLHFTGPDVYNVALRKVAMAQGKRLSEKGWNDDAADPPHSEADILRALGVAYQVPQDRCGVLPMLRP